MSDYNPYTDGPAEPIGLAMDANGNLPPSSLAAMPGYLALTPPLLKLRESFAGELYREGKITRTECFRIEMDAALGTDSGPVTFENNTEYMALLEAGWKPKRPDNAEPTNGGELK